MEVFYKFKSAKDYESIPIDWHYTTVADLKKSIFNKKCSGRKGKRIDFDLILINAQTNEEYLDGETLIPKSTSVIIRLVPKLRCMPIIITPVTDQDKPLAEDKLDDVHATKNSFSGTDSSVKIYPEWDEFWNYLSTPEVVPIQDAPPSKADEDSKIRALIDTPPALDWQCHNPDSFGAGRGFGRGRGGRSDGRGFGRGGLLERTTPPPGYICHRCTVPGHFIQHCPTNGDPTHDIKRIKSPTGIPKSMLVATRDGSYALPSGAVAVLKPNEAAFEKEIEGMPSTRSVTHLPTELYCPLCREVMKDAVLASKCCVKSFCDKCIRDYIISKRLCICGATNVLADDLLPNKTLRDTIVRISESNYSSGANGGNAFQPQDMESARCPQPKIQCPKVPSPTLSAASKGDVLAPKNEGNTEVEEMVEPVKVDNVTHTILGKVTVGKGEEVSEAAHECVREPGVQICPPVTDEEMQQKPVSGEVGMKKKKKKLADMQSRPRQDFAAENYMMPMELSGYNPYWNGMQPEFDGFGRPYGGQMPFMGYGLGPTSIPIGGAFHHDPFGAQVYMMPFPPQRDLAQFGTGFYGGGGPPIMNREEFEARKTTKKQKRDRERSGGSMDVSRDRDFSKDMISHKDVPFAKSKSNSITTPDYHQPLPRSERSSPDHSTQDPELLRTSSKRKVKYDDDYYAEHPHQHREKERRHHHRSESVSATRPPVLQDTLDLPPLRSKSSINKTIFDRKHNVSLFARITSPEGESADSKKRKLDSSPSAVNGSSHHSSHMTTSNGYHEDYRKTAASVSKNSYNFAEDHDYESSDDDRHFKRRRSRYESSPAPAVVEGRHSSRGSREKRVIAASIGRLSVY